MSTTEDWLYTDDLEDSIADTSRQRLDSIDSRTGDDLLDDVLTAPRANMGDASTQDDELDGTSDLKPEEQAMEESGSARYNADQMSRAMKARIESYKTSQGVLGGGTAIYSREPNRKHSIFIGNLTWWTTDLDLIRLVAESGFGEVKSIKFYENRTNGQSKGYAIVELASEQLALSATEKLQESVIYDQKAFVMYALRLSPHTFEAKCNAVKAGASASVTAAAGVGTNGTPGPVAPKVAPRAPNPTGPSITPNPMLPPMGGLPGMPRPPLPGMPGGFPGMNPTLPGLSGLMPPRMPPGFGMPFNMPGMDPLKAAGGGAHLNPAFLHEMAQNGGDVSNNPQNMMELFSRFRNMAAQGGVGGGSVPVDQTSRQQPSEDEISDSDQRNRAISSSAINRAITYSKSGDFEDAIDTLNLAIGLIRQSVTGNTEGSHMIIHTLSECLRGVEEQASSGSRRGRRDHRSYDDRSRHKSSKHHRDRSRERRR